MPFKYTPLQVIKPQFENSQHGWDLMAENRHILADGVKGLACLDDRPPTREERDTYEQFCPALCVLSWVEVYENGAMNIAVKSRLTKRVVGAILVRP